MFFLQDLPRCCALAYSPDGTHLAIGGAGTLGQGNLLLWNRAFDEKRMISLRGGPVQAVAFSPDGSRLAAAPGQTIRLIEVATGQEQVRFSKHSRQVRCLAFSPSGRFLLSGSEGRSLRYPGGEVNLWDVQRWQRGRPRLRTMLDEYRGFCSVAFLRGGRILLGGKNGEIYLWDRKANQYWADFNQRAAVRSVAISPCRGLLATAAGRVVHLWSLIASTSTRRA